MIHGRYTVILLWDGTLAVQDRWGSFLKGDERTAWLLDMEQRIAQARSRT